MIDQSAVYYLVLLGILEVLALVVAGYAVSRLVADRRQERRVVALPTARPVATASREAA